MAAIGQVIAFVLWIFIAMLFIRFIVDWVQMFARSWTPSGPILVLLEAVYSTTDPPIKALRKVLPTLRLGGIALDLSFLAVWLGAYLLLQINNQIFF